MSERSPSGSRPNKFVFAGVTEARTSRLIPPLPDATPDDREPRVVGVDDEDADDLIAALGSETSTGIKAALLRLLGGYGLIGLTAVAAQRVLSVAPPTYQTQASGDDAGAVADDEPVEKRHCG